MSPFQIKIMLHYHTTPRPYDGTEGATAVASTTQELVRAEMLCPAPDINYQLTKKGTVYVEKLMSTPYPIATTVWTFPEDNHDI